jgi:hypothetical protein
MLILQSVCKSYSEALVGATLFNFRSASFVDAGFHRE